MTTFKALRRSTRLSIAVLLALLAVLAVAAAPAMAEFGLQRFAVSARNQNGTPDVQAGSHPYSVTTTFVLKLPKFGGDIKNLKVELPPGFVGDPNATPHCTYQVFVLSGRLGGHPHCPNETAVGVATIYITTNRLEVQGGGEVVTADDPIYNLVPPTGVAAEFAFMVAGETPVFLDTTVRTGTDYGLNTNVPNISQAVEVEANKVTLWGVPSSPAHNDLRGDCVSSGIGLDRGPIEQVGIGLREGEDELEGPNGARNSELPVESVGECPTQSPEIPLLTNPTSCGTPRTATMRVDSWEEPGNYSGARTQTASLPPLEGCEKLDFSPTVAVTPDGTRGSTPTGLTVGLHVPQESTANPAGLAESDVKNTTVTLPPGVTLSASASDGLQACSIEQIGYTGMKELDPSKEPGVLTPQFDERVLDPANGREELTACPDASKVANVRIKTPLLENEISGQVYLAAPQNFPGPPENPFSTLVSMYLVAEEPVSGVVVKIVGKVVPNPVTGQVTATFDNTPALPFSNFQLEFFGTDRAPLVTPTACGTYKTGAEFEPWSGTPATDATSSFQILSGPLIEGALGPETAPCAEPPPFNPTLESGTTNINTGSFSELTTTISREDGQQQLSSVVLHYPEGISGLISGVTPCAEAQANAGTCGPESEIGETIISVGLGSDPFNVKGGKVYLTGPYRGAPFGLAIVNPAKAGPFVLQEGRPVVVRANSRSGPDDHGADDQDRPARAPRTRSPRSSTGSRCRSSTST